MELILILLAGTLGFSIVLISIPAILQVARKKKLFDSFGERKIHNSEVPSLGGIGIFLGFVLSTIISTDGYRFDSLKFIIAAVIIMLFIGLKDDLLTISARKKFLMQISAATLIITMGNVEITNLHGLFGIYQINNIWSLLISFFIVLSVINAFNLIDGIDGLASGLAMLATLVFGVWFFITGHIQFAVMSFALLGSLTAFFLYNVFGRHNKLFMGDAGSLVVGLIVSALVIKFNDFNILKSSAFAVGAAPSVSFAVVMVPLIDTLRIIIIRILNRKSPFHPDNNHIHHRLLALIPNHFKVTLILIGANSAIIGISLFLNHLGMNITRQFLLIFLLGIILSFVPSLLVKWSQTTSAKKRIVAKQFSEIGKENKLPKGK